MNLMTIAPLTQPTTGYGVRPVSEGKDVMMNEKAKLSNEQVNDGGLRSFLPDWEWLDDVGSTVGDVASTVFTTWAQTKSGVSGTESTVTSQGDPTSSTITGKPQKQTESFLERNKTVLMVGGTVLALGALLLAFKK
jgi:hypothetical protein